MPQVDMASILQNEITKVKIELKKDMPADIFNPQWNSNMLSNFVNLIKDNFNKVAAHS